MLVLSRKTCEEIVIDGAITIRILRISKGNVRVGITAPPDIHVIRREIAGQSDESQTTAD